MAVVIALTIGVLKTTDSRVSEEAAALEAAVKLSLKVELISDVVSELPLVAASLNIPLTSELPPEIAAVSELAEALKSLPLAGSLAELLSALWLTVVGVALTLSLLLVPALVVSLSVLLAVVVPADCVDCTLVLLASSEANSLVDLSVVSSATFTEVLASSEVALEETLLTAATLVSAAILVVLAAVALCCKVYVSDCSDVPELVALDAESGELLFVVATVSASATVPPSIT
ncbi:hypothetical protein FD04_GL000108 [Secundilactobacillus odoratitofui DSM 19909 = JCM 15043]|uniref:Uncharacterized protein n=1 Tax=Secundilactobacillus odoratitofui DSM 19909 = JCM 15043 TaxID=1423776 RepID=A0A0R1LU24_9LACO|nr:hypothetical protein FD04_GL000108 [Secundilactobacillus odoratitofui DSM 19909 = JCM 15043]